MYLCGWIVGGGGGGREGEEREFENGIDYLNSSPSV
jgi:hypothetical protein